MIGIFFSLNIYCNNHHHHHDVVPLARISLTLSRHFSLSFISSGRSSGLHPVSSHSCCKYVLTGRPAFARPYVEVHWSTSLMSSSLLLQQWPVCLVRLIWIVFMIGGRWPLSWCFVGCCRQDLFKVLNEWIAIKFVVKNYIYLKINFNLVFNSIICHVNCITERKPLKNDENTIWWEVKTWVRKIRKSHI